MFETPLISGFSRACPVRGCFTYETNMVSNEIRPYDGCVLPPQASAIEELHDWSLNFETGLNPYCLFIDIIGYSADRWGIYAYRHELKNCGEIFGYKELCLLSDALKVFENHGFNDVYTWCDALNSAEEDCN